MTNYNEEGVQYEFHAQILHAVIGGYLSENVISDFITLKSRLLESTRDAEASEMVKGIYGVLSQIDGFLLQAERLYQSLEELKKSALGPVLNPEIPRVIIKRGQSQEEVFEPPALIWLSSQKIEIDFDSLLSRATSALERLAKFACVALSISPVRNFFNLRNHIEKNSVGDRRADIFLSLIDEVLPSLHGTIVSDGRGRSVRNILTHHASLPELIKRGFSINWLADGRLLAFDLEIEGYPLVGTAHKIIGAFSHFMFNSIRIFVAVDKDLNSDNNWRWLKSRSIDEFAPTWPNPFIHYESYIDDSLTGPEVSVVKPEIGAFRAHTQHLREEVFDLAVNPKQAEKSNVRQ